MISRTSNIWSKSGPADLLIITKMAQTIQEKMESSWKNIMYVNLGLIFEKLYVLGTSRFIICPVLLWNFQYIFFKYVCGDED